MGWEAEGPVSSSVDPPGSRHHRRRDHSEGGPICVPPRCVGCPRPRDTRPSMPALSPRRPRDAGSVTLTGAGRVPVPPQAVCVPPALPGAMVPQRLLALASLLALATAATPPESSWSAVPRKTVPYAGEYSVYVPPRERGAAWGN